MHIRAKAMGCEPLDLHQEHDRTILERGLVSADDEEAHAALVDAVTRNQPGQKHANVIKMLMHVLLLNAFAGDIPDDKDTAVMDVAYLQEVCARIDSIVEAQVGGRVEEIAARVLTEDKHWYVLTPAALLCFDKASDLRAALGRGTFTIDGWGHDILRDFSAVVRELVSRDPRAHALACGWGWPWEH